MLCVSVWQKKMASSVKDTTKVMKGICPRVMAHELGVWSKRPYYRVNSVRVTAVRTSAILGIRKCLYW